MEKEASLLIINPISGQGRVRAARDRIIKRLSDFGPLEVVETRRSGDANAAARRAVEEGISRVIVAGGDGTVNEVINAIANSNAELGLIPQGTGNVLARELAIPIDDVEKACDVIAAGRTIQVDLARAGERYFALMAGIGFDAAVVDRLDLDAKDLLGSVAYGIAGIGELLRHKTRHFRVTMDGEVYETDASLVVIANVASYAMRIKIAPQAAYNDGLLDICVFESARLHKVTLLSQALRLMLQGSHKGDPNIRCFRAARIKVEAGAEPAALVQLDGDVVGETPIEIEVIPSALRIIAP